jgi:hypothetical protein
MPGLLVAVIFRVGLGRLCGVMGGVVTMAGRDMRVMAASMMIACRVVFGGFAVMTRRVFVVLGGLLVMRCG